MSILFNPFQNESPCSSTIDKLGMYLLVSLFFVVATMIEFAVALLVKRNPRWTRHGGQRVADRELKEKTRSQEMNDIKLVTNTNKKCADESLPYNGCPEATLHGANPLFAATK